MTSADFARHATCEALLQMTPSRKKPPPQRPRVVVADDVDDNRDVYALYFEHAGFDVAQARTGDEALACIESTNPVAVIMDLSMPGLDGWEATRLIKSNPRTKNVVVIVVTGHATFDDSQRARAAGADDVCTKPCLPDALLARVKALLERRG